MKDPYHVTMYQQTEPTREMRWAVVCRGVLRGLSYPDTPEGEATARVVAGHLNQAFRAGQRFVRAAIRDAMRDD